MGITNGIPGEIIIWRDSVAAMDDVFAPNEKRLKISQTETIGDVLEKIASLRYLPGIRGGKATWIVKSSQPLAVVAQQWTRPHFFVEADAKIQSMVDFAKDHQLEFVYWCQVEPDEVIACIKEGKPLPDRYGRK